MGSCDRIDLPGGFAFICSRGQRRPPCSEVGCTAPAVAECDYELQGSLAVEGAKPRTCDRRLCRRHAIRQPGRGADGSAERDYCPAHDRHEKARARAVGARP